MEWMAIFAHKAQPPNNPCFAFSKHAHSRLPISVDRAAEPSLRIPHCAADVNLTGPGQHQHAENILAARYRHVGRVGRSRRGGNGSGAAGARAPNACSRPRGGDGGGRTDADLGGIARELSSHHLENREAPGSIPLRWRSHTQCPPDLEGVAHIMLRRP
jgi:hypothetical protein